MDLFLLKNVVNNQSSCCEIKNVPYHLAKEEVKMKSLLRLLLKTHHQQNRSNQTQTEKGMTLIELLIGTVMAFLILTPMLAFVVDMLNTDRREQVKSNTEQDIQAAVDFIAQDLSQAIYIYDNNPDPISTPTNAPSGIPAIKDKLPAPDNGIPILVFWKRQQIKSVIPTNSIPPTATKPSECPPPDSDKPAVCNDTYVLSLVAYYEIKETDPKSIWCQPSGGNCPTRIERYEIRDGVKNPNSSDPDNPYYSLTEESESPPDPAFNKSFDISKPTVDVTDSTQLKNLKSGATKPQVLVNYIDHSPGPTPIDTEECKKALGNPTNTTTVPPTEIVDTTLRIPAADTVNSFYVCVDTQRNLAKVTIRGNSLRRLQTEAKYNANSLAFFPTASVQVQGLGARGK
jgi:type II secretory pathway pseudopilin PulG